MPAGLPLVQVTFKLDADGILTVSAIEARSGQSAAIEVIPGHDLDMEKVRKSVLDSIEHAAEDIASIRLITARTKAQTLIMSTKRALAQIGPDLANRKQIMACLKDSETACEGRDVTQIENCSEKLNQATHLLAEELLNSALAHSVSGQSVKDL